MMDARYTQRVDNADMHHVYHTPVVDPDIDTRHYFFVRDSRTPRDAFKREMSVTDIIVAIIALLVTVSVILPLLGATWLNR